MKDRPNDVLYLAALRAMTPSQKLRKVFELTEMTRKLFRAGLKQRFPKLTDDDLQAVYLDRLKECHNQSY